MKISVKSLKPGMVLYQNVYYSGNRYVPLIIKGAILNEELIANLKSKNIEYVEIDMLNETVPKELQDSAAEAVKSLNFKASQESVTEIINRISRDRNFVYGLDKYQLISEDEFNHAVNVCSFAVALTKSYNNRKDVKDSECIDYDTVALAALFHNIGLIFKNEEQLKKLVPINLNKYEYHKFNEDCFKKFDINMINVYAYSMLSNTFGVDFPPIVKNAILNQNEKSDGSGVLGRRRLNDTNEKVEKVSKIIHLCDIYDELLRTCIKEHQTPSNAIEILDYYKANGDVDAEFTDLLKNTIPLYSKGIDVKLSNGLIAKIYEYNPLKPTQPTVLINPKDCHIEIIAIKDNIEEHSIKEKNDLKTSLANRSFMEIQMNLGKLIDKIKNMDYGKPLSKQKHSVNINDYYHKTLDSKDHLVNICYMAICLTKKYNETVIRDPEKYLDYKRISNLVLGQKIEDIMDKGTNLFSTITPLVNNDSYDINNNAKVFEYTTKENEIISLCDLFEIVLTNCGNNKLSFNLINKYLDIIFQNNNFSNTTIQLLKTYIPLLNEGDDVILSNEMEATIDEYNPDNLDESLLLCNLVAVKNVTIIDICNHEDIYESSYKSFEESMRK